MISKRKLKSRIKVLFILLLHLFDKMYWGIKCKNYPQTISPSKILLIELMGIGDVVVTLPTVDAFRKLFPNAAIDMLVCGICKDILLNNPSITQIITGPITKSRFSIKDIFAIRKKIAHKKYDLTVVLNNNVRNIIASYLSNARSMIGYLSEKFDWEYSRDASVEARNFSTEIINSVYNKNEHISMRGLKIVKALNGNVQVSAPRIYVDENQEIESLFDKFGIQNEKMLVTISTGADWIFRKWDISKWQMLFSKIQSQNNQIILIGGHQDIEYNKQLNNNIIIDLTGKLSIQQLIYLLNRSRLFIGCDSGPMHIASAVGIPVVALMGPNSPERTGPLGNLEHVVYKKVECSPCQQINCNRQPTCMELIEVNDVYSKCELFL